MLIVGSSVMVVSEILHSMVIWIANLQSMRCQIILRSHHYFVSLLDGDGVVTGRVASNGGPPLPVKPLYFIPIDGLGFTYLFVVDEHVDFDATVVDAVAPLT